jgi:hypothetical protein
MYRHCGLVLVAVALAATAAGCGGATASTNHVTFVAAGQLPPSAIPTANGKGGHGITTATVPLAKASPTTSLFTAVGIFQSCLSGLGVTFIGVPSAADPNSAADNPTYIKALQTCAAKSNILQALSAEQAAQNNLTLSQVKKENQIYLKWRTCMIGRGWKIPTPTPNAKGLLFSFGGTSGGTSGFTPPPGQNVLSSSDLQACAAKAQAGTT